MKLRLSNNTQVEVLSSPTAPSTSVTDNFKSKATGILIQECPNVDAKDIVDSVYAYQSVNGRSKVLKNVRFSLPPTHPDSNPEYLYTGTYDELVSYATLGTNPMSGYSSDGIPQKQPAILGKWTISDYVDNSMLNTLSGDGTNAGLYGTDEPVLSSDYRLDWDKIAVQTLDSSKPNYNPAVAIILNEKGYGHSYENTQHFPGKWWLTTDEVTSIRSVYTWFNSVTGVNDTYGIVTNASSDNYKLTDLDALSGFTSVSSLEMSAFGNNPDLSSARFPSSVTTLPTALFTGSSGLLTVGSMGDNSISSIQMSAFVGCTKLDISDMGNNIVEIEDSAFSGCSSLTFSALPSSLSYVNGSAFKDCSSISITEIPSSVAFIGMDAFNGCAGIQSLAIKRGNHKVHTLSGAFDGGDYNIYVGGDNSGYLSNKTTNAYTSDVTLSAYASRFNSYYKKYYTEKLAAVDTAGEYELQDFITSDGKTFLNTTVTFTTGTRLEADISFSTMPSGDADAVHGSATLGLVGKSGVGLQIMLGGSVRTIASSSDFTNGAVHNYDIDLVNSRAKIDETVVASYSTASEGDGSGITFFGGTPGKFIGTSWSDRISLNGDVTHDYVPVRRKSDSIVGLYDLNTETFLAGDFYTSNDVGFKAYYSATEGIATEDGDLVELA